MDSSNERAQLKWLVPMQSYKLPGVFTQKLALFTQKAISVAS